MMKVILPALTIFLLSTLLPAQQLPEWYRVYTFDDSIVEMNTSEVRFGNGNSARLKFRWTFDKPETQIGEPELKYKSKLHAFEFDCAEKRFRPQEVTLYNTAGKIIRVEKPDDSNKWRSSTSSNMMEKFFTPACQLIELRRNPPPHASAADLELNRAAELAVSFAQQLEKSEDFRPLIKKYFATDYLTGYLKEKDTNWFLNLDRETASKTTRAELERFYIASLNAGYLSSFYLLSQSSLESDESDGGEKLAPPDLLRLIKNHSYTARYKGSRSDYDYLAENIDSPERLRSYTDLLEKVSRLMRKHVREVKAEKSAKYQNFLAEWTSNFNLYQPSKIVSCSGCLGLPRGTHLFEIEIPMLRLQLAQVNGEMKIVSAQDSSQ